MTDGRFVVELLDRGELRLHLAEQLERWRQYGDLLTPDELLLLPERIVFLTEIWEGLARTRQVVEGSLFRGDTDLRFDPRLPARPRRLALRHGPPVSSDLAGGQLIRPVRRPRPTPPSAIISEGRAEATAP
jgi:hypothetical protein